MSLLTLEKLKDKRFYETEIAIFRSVSEVTKVGNEGDDEKEIDMEYITVTAKISRATFYRHHRAAHLIMDDYAELVRMWVREKVCEKLERDEPEECLKKLFFELVLFIYKNRVLFDYFYRQEYVRVYALILGELRPIVARAWREWLVELYDIYAGEVMGVLGRWARGGYSEQGITRVLEHILFLTETASHRLRRFAEE